MDRVSWRRVALYYGISFGMVALLSAGFVLSGADFMHGPPALAFQLMVAFAYMPMPLVAGLIVERVAGRRPLIKDTFSQFTRAWKRVLAASAVAAVAVYLVNLALTGLLGNLLGIDGVGHLVFTPAEVMGNLTALLPPEGAAQMAGSEVPPVGLLYALGLVAGLIAGFTINGLFAFGEEYGWRGVLMDELAPLGPVRANLLTGVLWGLWHAPLIVLGFNYGDQRLLGVLMMCIWVTPLSFLLWRTREFSGSVLPAAIVHGAFNGSAGFFLILVADKNPLVGAPVGLLGALSAAVVAALVWRFTTPLEKTVDATVV